MAFDENDPNLMAELAELGFDDGEVIGMAKAPVGHRPRPVPAPAAGASGALLEAQDPGDLLKSLGVSLNSIGGEMVGFLGLFRKSNCGKHYDRGTYTIPRTNFLNICHSSSSSSSKKIYLPSFSHQTRCER